MHRLGDVAGGTGEGFVVGAGDVGDGDGEELGIVGLGEGAGTTDLDGALVGVVEDVLEYEGEVALDLYFSLLGCLRLTRASLGMVDVVLSTSAAINIS